jgi:hypothetical protein
MNGFEIVSGSGTTVERLYRGGGELALFLCVPGLMEHNDTRHTKAQYLLTAISLFLLVPLPPPPPPIN